jgi:biopolymer transport protein ExbB/biopolymer transport protein TolQ
MSFDIGHLWEQMTILNKIVVIILLLMSIYSLTVSIERIITFGKARKQSLAFARQVTGYLKQDNLQAAIDSTKKFKDSHLARVVAAGLYEFHHDISTGGDKVMGHDPIEAAERAIERESLMTTADMKKGLSGLATIGTTAPFIGLFGTVIGIINAFRGMALTGSGGIGAVSAGIAEALVATAIGLGVAIPAVWMFNFFLNKIERFQVEMSNSASELIDYFIKRRGAINSAGARSA